MSVSTTLLRHTITETPAIEQAVNCGLAAWPAANRADVMRQLIVLGADQVRLDMAARQAIVDQWAGTFTGAYPKGTAAALKDEWPQ